MPRLKKIETKVEDNIKDTVKNTVMNTIDILPETIIMNKPMGNVKDDVDMMSDKMPGRYILEYNTYNSKHLVSVYWNGVDISL